MDRKAKAPDETPIDLAEARLRVDAIDAGILRHMNERARLAQQIGWLKMADGTPIYASDRESEILTRLRRENPGPLPDSVLLAVYREIMSGSFALERTLRITFLGPMGSYSHLAAAAKFGASVAYEPVGDIAAVFMRVSSETVYRLAARGEVAGRKIGRIWRFPKDAIQQYVEGESAGCTWVRGLRIDDRVAQADG